MPIYIAAYDTESQACLAACRRIVQRHREHELPATFFITGRVLETQGDEYRALLDDPLFEIASHTYSHKSLRDHPFCGPAVSAAEIAEELREGKRLVEEVFGRPCLGVRPGCSFEHGLRGAPEVLAAVREAGYRYVSSVAWGKDYSMPAPLNQPFAYAEDGFPDLWELPCHGWHENLLKDHNGWGPRRLALWPAELPEAIPASFIKTPEDEFAINRVFLERVARDALTFVSLVWHPWSLHRFDPEMRMLDLTFRHARELGLEPATYAGLLERVSGAGA
ncbi:MAG: polysaccharide deacetylase family protein [Armatimonadota bacterium]